MLSESFLLLRLKMLFLYILSAWGVFQLRIKKVMKNKRNKPSSVGNNYFSRCQICCEHFLMPMHSQLAFLTQGKIIIINDYAAQFTIFSCPLNYVMSEENLGCHTCHILVEIAKSLHVVNTQLSRIVQHNVQSKEFGQVLKPFHSKPT